MGVLHTHKDEEVKLQGCRKFVITPSNTADITYRGAALYCNGDMTLNLILIDDPTTEYTQLMDTGDGTTTTKGSGSITNTIIKPKSIQIIHNTQKNLPTNMPSKLSDNGNGVLIGNGTGAVNYSTGVMTITWATGHIPGNGVEIYCSYEQQPTGEIMKLLKGYQPLQVLRVLNTSTDLGGEILYGLL